MARAWALTAVVAAYLLGVVGDAGASTGELTQKAGPGGCISDSGSFGACFDGAALVSPRSVTVSPDGTSAYVASHGSNAVAVFDRAATGVLTQKPSPAGCVSDSGSLGTCVDGTALLSPESVTVSPDGKSVYVASSGSNAVAVFDRAANGELTQKADPDDCIADDGPGAGCVDGVALNGATSVTVSPDGKNAYVASTGSGAVAVFDRAADGKLTQKGPDGCISDGGTGGACVAGAALAAARSVTVSPDGKSVYVASTNSNAVAVFDRAADGKLTQKASPAGCVSDNGSAGACVAGAGLTSAFAVTVSPDGKSAYVASGGSSAVAVFDRAADGKLTQKASPAGCISENGSAGACVDGTALSSAVSVTVSPDGTSAYVVSTVSGAVAVFDRAATGTLTQKGGTAGCISDTGTVGACVAGAALAAARSVTVSPDGTSVYVASADSNAMAVFDREPVPPPAPLPAVLAAPTPVLPAPALPALGAPAPTPPIGAPQCGRAIELLDVQIAKGRVRVSGLARREHRGQRASIRALISGSRATTATIQPDGSFKATLALPPRRRRATVSYQATIAGMRSVSVKLVRDLTIPSRKATRTATRVTIQVARPTGRQTITIDRRQPCTTYRRHSTVRTNRTGRVTITLPAATARDPITYYRAGRRGDRGRTYTLPIVIRFTTAA